MYVRFVKFICNQIIFVIEERLNKNQDIKYRIIFCNYNIK